jgi:hypothetical protein
VAWSVPQAAAAVHSLARIRAVESPPGQDGLKTVWHQGSQGADLLSHVDSNGRVRRQELTLLDDYFLWTAQHGLRTGRVVEDGGSKAAKGAATVALDTQTVADRLVRSCQALEMYGGADQYVGHMVQVLSMAVQGLAVQGEKTITRALSRDDLLALRAPKAGWRWWWYAVVAVVFGCIGFGAAFLATR